VKDALRRLQLHPGLAADAGAAEQKRIEAHRQRAATQADLDALPAPGNVARVADLAGLLRAGGAPAARLDDVRRKRREAEAALRTALAAVPDSAMSDDTLAATAAPSEARLEAAGRALTRAENAHQEAVKAQTRPACRRKTHSGRRGPAATRSGRRS
jgi:hypothetical protein